MFYEIKDKIGTRFLSDRQMVMRSCGDCTKCCEGYVSGNVKGHEMFYGTPCFFLQQGKCSDYENRPKDPCKSFECEWLSNPKVPDWLYPHKSGIIIHEQKIENHYYLRLTFAGNMPSVSALSWFLLYGIKNNINLCWVDSDGEQWSGDILFEEAMTRRETNG